MRREESYCPGCQRYKPKDEFYKNKGRSTGISSHCKLCHSEYYKEKYARNRQIAIELYGGKCCKCGFDNQLALQFDHIKGGTGLWNRGFTNWSPSTHIKDIIKSIPGTKYQLLCANCNVIKKFTEEEHSWRNRKSSLVELRLKESPEKFEEALIKNYIEEAVS